MGILKSYSRRSASFGQLAKYIAREDAVMKRDGKPFYFRHNLLGRTLEDMEKEFMENDKGRTRRANGIALYHDILSYHEGDADKLTPEIIEKIARKYVELRSDKALYFAAAHEDRNHIHIHFMASSTEAFTNKSISISIKDFQSLKVQLQDYEKEMGLNLSAVNHGIPTRDKEDREYQLELRTGQISRKEEIRQILDKSFSDAMSKDEFYENVKNDLKLYERGGKISGIDDNRHYRFSTLGYDEEKLQELEERSERMASFAAIRGDKDFEVGEELAKEKLNEDQESVLKKDGIPGREVE